MKITVHRCDLCGAKRQAGKLCQLTVPLTEEEKALRARTENPRRQVVSPTDYMRAQFYGMPLPGQSTGAITYDICRECVDGLLAARFREVRRMLTEEPK